MQLIQNENKCSIYKGQYRPLYRPIFIEYYICAQLSQEFPYLH